MGWFKELFQGQRTPPPHAATLGRDEKCWCGSGKKYKKCHFEGDREHFSQQVAAATCTSGG